MATRMSDSHALVERCKAAGWTVTTSSDGYRIHLPDGGIQGVHLTYSDIRSLNHAVRAVEKAGLKEAEAAVKKSRLTESRTRAQIAAEVADKRAQELAAQSSINRAAGPYLVDTEDVDLSWFITPHPAPWMRWCNITPQIARKLLGDHNADNRPPNKNTVKFYRDVILADMWALTHQGIAIDTRGYIQDGQHRLMALIAATEEAKRDISVPFAVFVGMPPENFKKVDEGMLRNARQLFGKAGEKNSGMLQTCVRLVYYSRDGDARRNARLKLSNQVVVDTFEADADEYREVCRRAQRDAAKAFISPGSLAAAMYLIRKVNGADNEYVGQFYDGLVSGCIPGTRTLLDELDPRAAVRDKCQRAKMNKETLTAMSQMGMVIATWNNCASNKTLRKLYFNDDSTIPAPLKCIPGQGHRPDAFGTLVASKQAA